MSTEFSWIGYGSYSYDWFLDVFFLRGSLYFMAIVFAVFLVLLYFNRKQLFKEFHIEKRTALLLLIVFVIGFGLRNAEYGYGVHTDGYIYAESARFMAETGLFVKDCAFGSIESCRLYEQVLYPPGYPFLIAVPSLLLGFNSLYAPIISALLSSLSVVLVFYIGRKMFSKEAGLFAAAVLALFPLELVFAGTANVRPSANFFLALGILLFLIAMEKRKLGFSCLAAAGISIMLYIHQQYVVLLLPLAVLLLAEKGFFARLSKKPVKKIIPVVLFLLLSSVFFYWLLFSDYRGPQGFASIESVSNKAPGILTGLALPLKGNQYLEWTGFSVLSSIIVPLLAIASVFIALKERKFRKIGFLWIVFVAFFLSTVLYSYCPSGKCLDWVRFVHPLVIPVSLLAGFSAWKLLEWVKAKKKLEKFARPELFLAVLLVVLFLTSSIPLKGSLFRDARREMPEGDSLYFEAVENIPNNCTIISPFYLITGSDVFPENKRRTANVWLVFESTIPILETEISESNCVFLITDNRFTRELEESGSKFIQGLDKELVRELAAPQFKLKIYRIK